MNDLIRHIEYLLTGRDCVVIPGLGAVLAHGSAACYDAARGVFVAPSRSFSFNPELDHNDGVLAWSLARRRGLAYDAAVRALTVEVDALRRVLTQDGVLPLGRAGVLRLRDGRLDFEPGDASALSPSTLWLPQVGVLTCEARRERRQAVEEAVIVPSRLSLLRSRIVRFAKVAASIAVLVMLGVVLSTPVKVDNPQYASIGYQPVTEAQSQLLPYPGEASSPLQLVLSRHDDASAVADTAVHNAYRRSVGARKSGGNATAVADAGKYCLVIASLESRAEAERFVARNSELKLGILAKDGRYRVYAASAPTYAEALQAAQATVIAARYPDAWVCRR